jgi:hypothetical protein
MDRISKSHLEDFMKSQEFKSVNESADFEKLCNYSIFANEYNKTFDVNSITVGSGSDTGIDGLAIIVNGHLVEDVSEVDDLLEQNGMLEVTYIFIQSKTTSSFDTASMFKFYHGVADFFEDVPKLPQNEDIKDRYEISNYIFDHASSLKKSPRCKTYFVTTGVVREDANISAAMETSKVLLMSTNLFETVESSVVGSSELAKLYRKAKSPTLATFTFSHKVTLPAIEGINQSYFGILPFSEFKKILIDENGNMVNVFEENVRAFQGAVNPVNKSISNTLTCENPSLFSVLNNGITIIANSIKTSADTFTISDFQIVNGCQTSNVLFENMHVEAIDFINIPIRLIVTNDDEIKFKVTESTNNQTTVKKDQLESMSDFQKNLEMYYNSITGEGKLYYERRSKQYSSDLKVVKRKVITLSNQIKTYSSMFNKNPHMVTTYYGRLVKGFGTPGENLFEKTHQFAPYYLAGLVFYKLDSLFNSGVIDKKYKKVKFYLIMLVPMIASSETFTSFASPRKAEKYCQPLVTKLLDEKLCEKIFLTAVKIVDKSSAPIEDKQALKSKAMTNLILEAYDGESV